MEELKKEMIANALSYNNCLTEKYFADKTIRYIMSFTHPLDREGFISRFVKLNTQESNVENN